ncbi:MAG: ribonuclease H-like domain-containing protein [Deltaproteobacteria bacterium]|jgi:uncharacterized protein YprB with RNaseH-like and TPR domain|nr:ribonuclease H-like domain-containing protein [Deltaproteobacteria bacterium]
MLNGTFVHYPGIDRELEGQLWASGVLTHEQLMNSEWAEKRNGNKGLILETQEALAKNDHDFFANRLPVNEQYRLAAACPKETIFLDIETTGLRLACDKVTIIGWSLGGVYDVVVCGRDDPAPLFQALSKAKALVTFNGKSFDLKFVSLLYPQAPIPKAHADLRYVCRDVGLTGGQKIIETTTGLRRDQGLGDGAEAVRLWFVYRSARKIHIRQKALQDLIVYNHADVEGMKHIFDVALERLFERNRLPPRFKPDKIFSSLMSNPFAGREDFPFSLDTISWDR